MICTDYLALGLRCDLCMRRQHLPHSDEAEHTCDECGRVVGAIHSLSSTIVLSGIRIREPKGRSGRYTGPVFFVALGVCSGCWKPGS